MEYFRQTCDKLYDHHTYELHLKSGKKLSFNFWEEVQEYWFLHSQMPDYLDKVIVKDKKKRKSSGFS